MSASFQETLQKYILTIEREIINFYIVNLDKSKEYEGRLVHDGHNLFFKK